MSFDKNDRAAIEAALQDANAENPIAIAVADRITAFTKNLFKMAERNGKLPTELLLKKPETEFDDIVIHLTLQAMAKQMNHKISIHWVN